ncbi:gas vesicle protein GvpO [Streptomyces sp. RFCAC02]|uniref:gas vesicle protein GvpO n=1 Tax=Streptomyces sp. RFCAC02 TaxID=2499143 RepID=UPI00101EE66A|nr:gas vesicle protein GvpO [Streptomyces sp. RFCAC02]
MAEKRRNDGSDDNDEADVARTPRPVLEVVRTAGAEFTGLTGLQAEAVTRVERTGDGWLIEAEVVELARVPETMSLMAAYEVTTDAEGRVTGYRRTRRYDRGRADRR